MAAIQTEIYDAFISAGAEEPKARAAAQVMADYPKPEELATKEYIDRKIAELEVRMGDKFSELQRIMWIQSITTVGIILTAIGIAVAILSK